MHACKNIGRKSLDSLICLDKISMVWDPSCMQPNHLHIGNVLAQQHENPIISMERLSTTLSELFCTQAEIKSLSMTIPNAKLIKIPRVFAPMFQLGPCLDHMALKVHWNTALMAPKSLWYQYVTSESMLIPCVVIYCKEGESFTGGRIDNPLSLRQTLSL